MRWKTRSSKCCLKLLFQVSDSYTDSENCDGKRVRNCVCPIMLQGLGYMVSLSETNCVFLPLVKEHSSPLLSLATGHACHQGALISAAALLWAGPFSAFLSCFQGPARCARHPALRSSAILFCTFYTAGVLGVGCTNTSCSRFVCQGRETRRLD